MKSLVQSNPSKTLLCLGLATSLLTAASNAASLSFSANLLGSEVVPTTTSTASGLVTLTLNNDQTALAYSIQLFGVDLDPVMGNRTDLNDVTHIHFHLGAAGENGPHVLNVFGMPSEDDADLVVDYGAETLSGVWDDSDVLGPGPYLAIDTKPLTNFLAELQAGELYIQVHTVQFPAPGEIRGQIVAVPEPGSLVLFGLGGLSLLLRRRR